MILHQSKQTKKDSTPIKTKKKILHQSKQTKKDSTPIKTKRMIGKAGGHTGIRTREQFLRETVVAVAAGLERFAVGDGLKPGIRVQTEKHRILTNRRRGAARERNARPIGVRRIGNENIRTSQAGVVGRCWKHVRHKERDDTWGTTTTWHG